MASIVKFPAVTPKRRATGLRGPAAIIIFPGVRYERLGDGRKPAPKPRRTRRSG